MLFLLFLLNWSWIIFLVGYDKLKPFGFPIHGAIDGFSRKVLWLEVCKSNNSPTEPTNLYLDCVEEHGGCPMITRTDYGTENCNIAAIQCYFRSDEEAHKYGTSDKKSKNRKLVVAFPQITRTFLDKLFQRLERWWIDWSGTSDAQGMFMVLF
jgi:hypothetical protein